MKITFVGAGSTAFVKNVLGDTMLTPALKDCEIALYDIDAERLEESRILVDWMNQKLNDNRAKVKSYLGVENRKDALRGSDFIINAIAIGGFEATKMDFEIPKKYGIRQTIADTLGIGGIFRGLRVIPVLRDIAQDVEEVCPDAWFLNYSNPMAMNTGFLQRYTGMKTIGLCHSWQTCIDELFETMRLDLPEGVTGKIAGINHMAWLLEIRDKDGNDLYPMLRERAEVMNTTEKHSNMVRFEYIRRFGYYCTESTWHNAEYNPFFIKSHHPELIEKYNIPLERYIRTSLEVLDRWQNQKEAILSGKGIEHPERSIEYPSRIMEAMVTNVPYSFGGNVINNGLIPNLVKDACVEVPCLADANGIQPTYVGDLPTQLAAMNMTNVNPQLLTIEAAVTKKREAVYQAAMLDPHTAAELPIDDIVAMCDEMIEAHNAAGNRVLY